MLAGNLAVVSLFVLGWANLRFWLRDLPGAVRSALFGLTMGLGAAASLLMAAEVVPGYFLDLRVSLVALSAFFGGPLAMIVTLAVALPARVAMGGDGLLTGVGTIIAAALAGLAGRLLIRRGTTMAWHGVVLGAVAGIISGTGFFLLPGGDVVHHLAPLALLNMLATSLAGTIFLKTRRFTAERDLLVASMIQAPDYFYVKDRLSRFVAVNARVLRLYGFTSPQQIIGKTDFDLTTPERARKLFEDEQRMMASGESQTAIEEELVDEAGVTRHFTTIKLSLRAVNGELIGMAGVTRDITEDRQLRHDLIESRNALSYALAEMSDGLAMFDSEGRILLCNEQYSAAFPYTGHLRKQGALLRDILREVVRTGEQLNIPAADPDGWLEAIVDNLGVETEEEVNLFDGRWLQVRTRPTSEAKTLVVITDVTRIKQAELALKSATDQLRYMVRTDALTGLLNRRAFDDGLEAEIGRSSRAGTPMSLLMIDVDHFKAYNDRYGHPAGDACLKLVTEHLQRALKRPADLAARYGGEEFAAILPDTDEDGAYLVAESFRRSLAGARLPHEAGACGILTASVGVATYMPDNLQRSAAEILRAADEALYSAKAAGRDRVFGRRITRDKAY